MINYAEQTQVALAELLEAHEAERRVNTICFYTLAIMVAGLLGSTIYIASLV
jgi:hypothetical protein